MAPVLDLKSCNYQNEMDEADKTTTAFVAVIEFWDSSLWINSPLVTRHTINIWEIKDPLVIIKTPNSLLIIGWLLNVDMLFKLSSNSLLYAGMFSYNVITRMVDKWGPSQSSFL